MHIRGKSINRRVLVGLVLAILIACTPTLVAKPTEKASEPISIPKEPIITLESVNKAVESISVSNITKTSKVVEQKQTVSLEPPKIDPKLVEELKKLKKEKKKEKIKVLINAKDKQSLEKVKQEVTAAGGTVSDSFDVGSVAVVELPAEKIEAFSESSGVEGIGQEKEYIAFVQDRIEAFNIPQVWAQNVTGKGARVAILDTGISHDSLAITRSHSFVANEDGSDQSGHGTHVAGIVHAVAPDAQLYNAKVLDKNGRGLTSQILAGINWAVDPDGNPQTDDGADIISMSFGGTFSDTDGPLASAVRDAINHGVVFVVASGNCRQGCGGFFGVTMPGNLKEVITVGAVKDDNTLASFSSGDTFDGYIKPDVVAPGIDITSTWIANTQKTLSGTSMSTPFVAGLSALILEKEPQLSNQEVKERLTSTALDAGSQGWDSEYGAGVILPPNVILKLLSENVSENISDDEVIPLELTNYTIIFENETAGKYVYHSIDDDFIFEFEFKDAPEEEYESQMILPKGVLLPKTLYGVTFQFELSSPPPNKPSKLQFTIKKGNSIVGSPENFALTKSFVDKIMAINKQTVVEMSTSFKTPNAAGEYNANAELLNANSNSYNPKIIDKSGSTPFAVGTEQNEPVCWFNRDCGSDGFVNSPVCKSNDVWQDYKTWECLNAGTPQASCSPTTIQKLKQNCPNMCSAGACVAQCNEGYTALKRCNGKNVEQEYTYSDCSATWKVVQACTVGCSNGACLQECAAQYTGAKRCNGNVVEREYQNADCSKVWKSDGACAEGQFCQSGTCQDNGCQDYGLNYGSCMSEGQRKREGSSIFECVDQIWIGVKLCWEPIAALGDSDFCSLGIKCNRNEYDCDSDVECVTGFCSGTWPFDSGCCSPNEKFDSTLKKCKGNNGAACSSNNDCVSNFCYASICRNAPICGNGICESDTGENSASCLNDCKLANGASCSKNSDCQSSLCYNGKCEQKCVDNDGDGWGTSGFICPKGDAQRDCRDDLPAVNHGAQETCDALDNNCNGQVNENNVCCGNKLCDNGETPATCSGDCFGKLQIVDIISAPSQVEQGQQVQIVARIKNEGTYKDTLKLEAAIVPDSWQNVVFSEEIGAQAYSDVKGCCETNTYYDTKEIELGPGVSENVIFTVIAPTIHSVDTCGQDAEHKSAWDVSHTVFVGLYDRCKGGYKHKDTQDIKVKERFCSKPTDCSLLNEKCEMNGFTGVCRPRKCTSVCDKDTFKCSSDLNAVVHCEDTNADSCYEWKAAQFCPAGTTCANSKCVGANVQTKITAEESNGITIFKQTEDVLTINLKYVTEEQITLLYDTNLFELLDCDQTFTIKADKQCTFFVKGESGEGAVSLEGGAKTAISKINNNPSGIILTNKKKLYERFKGAETEVNKLLVSAYAYAQNNNLILYDLDKVISQNHPWMVFSDYPEKGAIPFMRDNAYAQEISDFVQRKCQTNCKSAVILGDDFVVPFYRREFPTAGVFIWSKPKIDAIYSDISYIKRARLDFSDFDKLFIKMNQYGEQSKGKNVRFIIPVGYSNELRSEVSLLQHVLEEDEYQADVSEMSDADIICNDNGFYDELDDKTVIIFGENNKALQCFAFVPKIEDSFFIEVNPWDNKEHAMIIKTDEQIHLQTLRNLIQSGKIKNIQSEWIGNVEMGLDGVSLLTSIIGGDVFVDPFDASFQCFVKVDMIGCSAGGASILVPMLTSAKARILLKEIIQIAKSPLWKIMVKEWRYAFKIIDKLGSNGKYFVEGVRQLNKLPDDVLERTLKTFDDYESAAKGFALLKVKNIEDIEVYKLGKLSKDNLVAGLKQLGDLQNRGVQVRKDVLVQMRSQNDVGHWAQITYAHSKLADPDVTLKVVGQKINVNGAEMDLDTVLQKKGTNKAIVDEVKNGQLTVNRDFEEQIDKLLSTKGQTIEIAPNVRVEIEKVRLAVSRKQVVPSAVNEYLTERKIEIVYFDGV